METTKQKSPSYLSQVKAELLQSIIEGYATSRQQAEELTDRLWKFLSPKLAQSYWNGVSAGASGRVRPKADRPAFQAGRESRAFNAKGKPEPRQ